MSGHWTDDELIAYLYGVGPENRHLYNCHDCQTRLAAMQSRRAALATVLPVPDEKAEFEFFAAQRRKIYAKITERSAAWWTDLLAPRWITAAASLAILGGVAMYEQHDPHGTLQKHMSKVTISDAQLASEVGTMSQDLEPQATAPLQELFDE